MVWNKVSPSTKWKYSYERRYHPAIAPVAAPDPCFCAGGAWVTKVWGWGGGAPW